MTEEIQILLDFARTASQPAFTELVRRYVDVVYSAARRQVRNDAHAAEDVTQAVFLLLAQKAKSVPTDRPLSAWLLRATEYCAANARRKRDRQELYIRRSAMAADTPQRTDRAGDDPDWEMLSPLLDQGINTLPASDRDAVLLRFMEKKTLRQIGESLGISEEAAQKRVSRAVDKLREFFQRKGVVTMSAGALATALAARSVQAAPTGLAGSVAAGVTGAGTAAGGGISLGKGASILMATGKAKIAIATALILLLGLGGAVAYVTMFAPPSHRTVAAAGAPAVLPQVADVPRPQSPWPMKFSDGTTLDVLAINDPNSDPNKWWKPDGSLAANPRFQSARSITMRYPKGRRIDLIVHMTGTSLLAKGLTVKTGISQNDDTATMSGGSAADRLVKVITVVDRNASSGTLRFGLAGGAWADELSLPCGNGAKPDVGATGAGITFRDITEDKGQTVVHFAIRPAEKQDTQLVVVADGKELPPAATWANAVEDRYYFKTRRAKVTQIIARARPYQWVELKNMSLRPGKASVVEVGVPSKISVPETTVKQ